MKHYTRIFHGIKVTCTLVLLAVLTFSCQPNASESNRDSATTETAAPIAPDFNALMAPFAPKPQTFMVSSKKPSTITGKAGTRIHVQPKHLVMPDGSPVKGDIQVNLIECTGKSQLIGAGLQTVADGKLLESGGSYYIDMQADGQPLQLKAGKSMQVEFPQLTEQGMELFYGSKNEAGQLNWEAAGVKFEVAKAPEPRLSTARTGPIIVERDTTYSYLSETDTLVSDDIQDIWAYLEETDKRSTPKQIRDFNKEQAREKRAAAAATGHHEKRLASLTEMSTAVYEAVNLNRFGWYNCDRFLNEPDIAPVVAELPKMAQPGIVYFILKSRNAIIQSWYYAGEYPTATARLPIGEEVVVMAMEGSDLGGQCGFAQTSITVGKAGKVGLRPKATPVATVKQAFAAL